MLKNLVLVAFLAAFAVAQIYPTTLTDSVSVSGVLPITTTANNYAMDYYQFLVPANASALGITFVNTNLNSGCTYLHNYFRTSGLPCAESTFNSSYLCRSANDPGDGVSGTNYYTFYPGDEKDLAAFVPGQYFYIGINRYSTYNTYACTYTLTVNASTCPVGQIGNSLTASGSTDQVQCSSVTDVTSFPYTANITSDPANAYIGIWRISIPFNTGHVIVTARTFYSNTYLYGNSYSPSGSSSDTNCYTNSQTSNGDGSYNYTLICYTPRAGDFYITLRDSNGFSNASMTIFAPLVCPTGMGGFNCTYNSTALNATSLSQVFSGTLPIYSSAALTYPFVYYYFDIPMNYSGPMITVTLTSSGGSTYLYRRINGFPEDSSTYGYEVSGEYDSTPSSFIVDQHEYGRIFFGVECASSSTPCNYQIGFGSSAQPISSTTGAAAGSTTAASNINTSGASTTGASNVVTTSIRSTTSQTNITQMTSGSAVISTTSSAMSSIPCFFLAALIVMMM